MNHKTSLYFLCFFIGWGSRLAAPVPEEVKTKPLSVLNQRLEAVVAGIAPKVQALRDEMAQIVGTCRGKKAARAAVQKRIDALMKVFMKGFRKIKGVAHDDDDDGDYDSDADQQDY
jgi:hypothetical protein